MKKLIVIPILLIFLSDASSQIYWGLQGGLNFSSGRFELEEDFSMFFDPRAGLGLGVIAEIPISSSIKFRPELNLINTSSKHAHSSDWFIYFMENNRINLTYITIPLNFVYDIPLASSQSVFFGAGPSFAIGMGGKLKLESETNGVKESATMTVKFDGKDSDDGYFHLKRLNMGLGFLAGYRFSKNFYTNLSYNAGLSDISPYDGLSVKTSCLELKAGYMFGSRPPEKK